MDLRRVTGYIALAVLAGYLLWVLSRTAPELRKGARDRGVRARVLLVKIAALALAALFVGTVHFWAVAWWQVAVAVPVTLTGALVLRRMHRRLVAPPRHRVALAQRVRRTGHFQVIRTSDAPAPHRHSATEDGAVPGTAPFELPGRPAGPGPDTATGPATGTDGPAPDDDRDTDGDTGGAGDDDRDGGPVAEPTGEPGPDRAENGSGDRPDPPTT